MGVDYSAISGYGIYTTAKQMFEKLSLESEEKDKIIEEYYDGNENYYYNSEASDTVENFINNSEYKDVVKVEGYGSYYGDVIDYVLLFKPTGRLMSEEFIESFRKFERFLNEFNFKNQIEFINEILVH